MTRPRPDVRLPGLRAGQRPTSVRLQAAFIFSASSCSSSTSSFSYCFQRFTCGCIPPRSHTGPIPSSLAAALPFLSILGSWPADGHTTRSTLRSSRPPHSRSTSLSSKFLSFPPQVFESLLTLRCAVLSPSPHPSLDSLVPLCGMECGRRSLPSLVSPVCSRVSSLSHSSPPQLSSHSYFEGCGGALRH